MDLEFLKKLIVPAQTKIVMLIMNRLGGLPLEPGGKTELGTAHTPNLDKLVASSAFGLSQQAGPNITVGRGLGHLAIFIQGTEIATRRYIVGRIAKYGD